MEGLYAVFTRLAEMPGMGHHREDLADARHRFWTVYSYVSAYRDQARPLEIIEFKPRSFLPGPDWRAGFPEAAE